jgi:hypothetical protein
MELTRSNPQGFFTHQMTENSGLELDGVRSVTSSIFRLMKFYYAIVNIL